MDDAGDRRDDRRPFGGGDVLTLVGVAGAADAEAGVGPAEAEGPWTGKILEPAVVSAAGTAGPGAGVGAITFNGAGSSG